MRMNDVDTIWIRDHPLGGIQVAVRGGSIGVGATVQRQG